MIRSLKTKKWLHSTFIFVAVFLILFLYSIMLQGFPLEWDQPYDSGEYLRLSKSFVKDGGFSLANYPKSIRGYLFPLLLLVFRCLLFFCSENMCVLIMNCTAVSVFATWTIRRFVSKRTPTGSKIAYLSFLILFLLYWVDLLTYALTDFIAFWWLLCSVLLWENCRLETLSPTRKYIQGFLCGVLTYSAYNFRPNISFSLVAFWVWILICVIRSPRRYAQFLLTMFAGIALMAFPQMLINFHHLGSWSPAVSTGSFAGQGLTLYYLNNGLIMRRYETFAGDPGLFQSGEMIFSNRGMAQLLRADGINLFNNLSDYIIFVIRHPFECLAVYIEHLINLLTPIFRQIYIRNFYIIKVPHILLNFGLFASGIADWVLRTQEGEKPLSFMHQKGLLIPVLVQFASILPVLAGKVETRYALAIYLFLYLYVCWHVNWKRLWYAVRSRPWLTLFILSVSLSSYLIILSITFASFDGPIMRLL